MMLDTTLNLDGRLLLSELFYHDLFPRWATISDGPASVSAYFFCLVSFQAPWNKIKTASVFCQSSASDEDPSLIVAPMETRHWNTSVNRRRLSTCMILTTAGIHLENISRCLHVFSEVAAHFPPGGAVAVYTSVGAAVLMDGGGGRKHTTGLAL